MTNTDHPTVARTWLNASATAREAEILAAIQHADLAEMDQRVHRLIERNRQIHDGIEGEIFLPQEGIECDGLRIGSRVAVHHEFFGPVRPAEQLGHEVVHDHGARSL